MAKTLNQNRMQYSALSVLLCILIIVFTKPLVVGYDEPFHELIEYAGYFLIAICALGRVYSSAFLGGFKNKDLITYGPFSVVRNPLYVFSLIGVLGVSLVSGHLTIVVFLTLFFVVMYHFLIRREEAFLRAEFGEKYEAYTKSTPRLIPKLSLYNAPDEIKVKPRFIVNACCDAIWWFVPFPVFEFIEYLQEADVLPVLMNF